MQAEHIVRLFALQKIQSVNFPRFCFGKAPEKGFYKHRFIHSFSTICAKTL
jgi:hypothetical protein